jgi:hypothetical protein
VNARSRHAEFEVVTIVNWSPATMALAAVQVVSPGVDVTEIAEQLVIEVLPIFKFTVTVPLVLQTMLILSTVRA